MTVSFALHGVGVSSGIAIGRAQLVSHATREVAHYTIPAAQVQAEIVRFASAITDVRSELEGLHTALTDGTCGPRLRPACMVVPGRPFAARRW